MERYYYIKFNEWIKDIKKDDSLKTKKPKEISDLFKLFWAVSGLWFISVLLDRQIIGLFLLAALVIIIFVLIELDKNHTNKIVYSKQDTYKEYCKKIAMNFKNEFKVEKAEHFEMILKEAEESREKIYFSSISPIKTCEKIIGLVSIPLISVILTKILDISFELKKGISVSNEIADDIQAQVNSFENLLTKIFWIFIIIMIISGIIAYLSSKIVSKDIKQYDEFIYYLKGIIETERFGSEDKKSGNKEENIYEQGG